MINSTNFSLRIERIVQETGLDYMDAICYYCEENEMEIETAAALINSKIREFITMDANRLNLLKDKEKYATLPV